jgi:HJR/Mrr/RecB family endonuclease
MLESAVQKKIITYLKKENWFVTKIISCSTNGIPDLMAIKNGQTIFIEVKQKGKKVKKGGLQEYRINCFFFCHNVCFYIPQRYYTLFSCANVFLNSSKFRTK